MDCSLIYVLLQHDSLLQTTTKCAPDWSCQKIPLSYAVNIMNCTVNIPYKNVHDIFWLARIWQLHPLWTKNPTNFASLQVPLSYY